MKKIAIIFAIFGFGLICLQQKSYAEKKTSHVEYKDTEIKECNSCHKSEGVALNHDADFVSGGHRVLAGKAGNNCSQCHEQKWCLDCHKGGGSADNLAKDNFGRDYVPKSHRSDFLATHPIKASSNPQQCYRCHDAVAFCNSCHSRFPKGSMRIKSHLLGGPGGIGDSGLNGARGSVYNFALSDHATEARRNLQSCQTCHPEGDVCIKCHNSATNNNPHPRSWKSGNIKSKTNAKMCLKCHLPGTY
jgi:hypothetical protein